MKSKVIGVYVSIVLMFIACAIIIVFSVWVNLFADAMKNIGYGILGSSVVTFVITFSEYFIEKRKALEKYLTAIYDCLKVISNITYTRTVKEKYIIADFVKKKF